MKKNTKILFGERCQSVYFKYQAGEMQNKIFRVIYTLNQIKSMFGLWEEEKPGVPKENKKYKTVAEQSG